MERRYKILFRGDSFRSNNCKSLSNSLDDPTLQINAFKTIKKFIVECWKPHGIILDEVIASTYSTKFDDLLNTELKNIFDVNIRCIFSEKLNSDRNTTIRSGISDITNTNILICRFDLVMREELRCKDMKKALFPCWNIPEKPQVSDHFFWIPSDYIEIYKDFANNWDFSTHNLFRNFRHMKIPCDVFRDITIASNPHNHSSPPATYENETTNPWTIFAPCGGSGV